MYWHELPVNPLAHALITGRSNAAFQKKKKNNSQPPPTMAVEIIQMNNNKSETGNTYITRIMFYGPL